MCAKLCLILYACCLFQGSLDFDPVILEGFVARSRFGLTVAKLGDIDADGREGETVCSGDINDLL